MLLHLGSQASEDEQNLAIAKSYLKQLKIRRAIPKTKTHSEKIVHFMTISFFPKITSNTLIYILSNPTELLTGIRFELKYETSKISKRSSKAENKITFQKNVPYAKSHQKT